MQTTRFVVCFNFEVIAFCTLFCVLSVTVDWSFCLKPVIAFCTLFRVLSVIVDWSCCLKQVRTVITSSFLSFSFGVAENAEAGMTVHSQSVGLIHEWPILPCYGRKKQVTFRRF